MGRQPMSLKTRLALTYGAISLLIIGILLWVTHGLMENHFQTYVVAQRDQTAQNAVKTVEEQLQNSDLRNIRYTELGYALLRQGLVLSVWDAQGKQVYCIHCDDTKACESMLYDVQCLTSMRDAGYKGTYTEMEYPLAVNGQHMGSLHFGYSGPYYYTAADVDFITRIDTVFLFAGVFCALLAAGLGFVMARSIVRPIREIGENTKRIGQGDYTTQEPSHPYARELSELAKDVSLLSQTLMEQQKARERMVRDYAHELRTPLSVLQANLEAFEDGVWEPTPQRLGSCYEEIERLNRMLCKLEELASLYKPGTKPAMDQVELESLVMDCLQHFSPVCKEKKIELASKLMPISLTGDRDQLRQVLVNLLANAVQYTPESGTIEVTVSREDDLAVIKVSDTGIGIDISDLPYIFDYLYRADPSRNRHTGGSGIGLSIVQKIVREHGGEVLAESQPGAGSVFTVKLPISRP